MFTTDHALMLKPELNLLSQEILRWFALALLVAIFIWLSMSVFQAVLPGGGLIPFIPIQQLRGSCGAVALPC